MTESAVPNESVDLTTKWFGLKLNGPNAILILLFILIIIDIASGFYLQAQWEKQHEEEKCIVKLSLYVQTLSDKSQIDWRRMPVDLYPCIPKFLYDRAGINNNANN